MVDPRIDIRTKEMLNITPTQKSCFILIFMFFCLLFAIPLCASVYMCLVVTCWERADLLALVCGV